MTQICCVEQEKFEILMKLNSWNKNSYMLIGFK